MKFIAIIGIILVLCIAPLAHGTDYETLVKETYKQIEVSPSPESIRSWENGLKTEYGLIFDHLGLSYRIATEADTTDGNHLVCGILTVTAYARDTSGAKKRVVQNRAICHLFREKDVIQILKMGSDEARVILGWGATDL